MGAFRKFLTHFRDLVVPSKALDYAATRPETWTWMKNCLNVSARVDKKPETLSSFEKLCSKLLPSRILPVMIPGLRYFGRVSKQNPKGVGAVFPKLRQPALVAHTYKIVLESGAASFSVNITFGYREQERRRQCKIPPEEPGASRTFLPPPSPPAPARRGSRSPRVAAEAGTCQKAAPPENVFTGTSGGC